MKQTSSSARTKLVVLQARGVLGSTSAERRYRRRRVAKGATICVVVAALAGGGCGIGFDDSKEVSRLRELAKEPILKGMSGWKELRHTELGDFNSQVEIVEEWQSPLDPRRARVEVLKTYGNLYVLRRLSGGPDPNNIFWSSRRQSATLSVHFLPSDSPSAGDRSRIEVSVRAHA